MKSILYELTQCELQILLDTSDGYSDLLRKLGLNPKGDNPKTFKKIIKEYELDTTQLQINRSNLYRKLAKKTHIKQTIPLEDILTNKITKPYSSAKLLQRLVKAGYKQYRCEQCGITEWNNKPIVLQLEHKDGNHNNNTIDNLQILCPNCHSQTATFAGRNVDHSDLKRNQRIKEARQNIKQIKKQQVTKPPIERDVLKKLIRNVAFVNIGKQFGVTDNAVRKWCVKYNLPRKVSVIKTISDEEWENI